MLISAYKAKSGECMKTQFFQKISSRTARRTGSYLHPAIAAGVTGVLVLSQDYRLGFETRLGQDSEEKKLSCINPGDGNPRDLGTWVSTGRDGYAQYLPRLPT